MNRRTLFFALSGIAIATFLYSITPKRIDWTPTFSKYDKIPYGCYILFRTIDSVFTLSPTTTAELSPYEELEKLADTSLPHNYIFITRDFSPDRESIKSLLDFVERGNTLFIAANQFDQKLCDTLGVDIDYDFDDSTGSYLYNTSLPTDTVGAKKRTFFSYFAKFDTTSTIAIGYTGNQHPNFLCLRRGNGTIYLHTAPHLFSNYYLLTESHRAYSYAALSFMPVQATIWDEYLKHEEGNRESPLSIVARNPMLKGAYYLMVWGLLLFLVFQSKRQQRIIPLITPLKNATLEFVRTVGKLYFRHRDSKTIIEKKILYFHDYLRNKFYLREIRYNEDLYTKIALKTLIPLDDVRALFGILETIQGKIVNDDNDVIRLNKLIEEFKAKVA